MSKSWKDQRDVKAVRNSEVPVQRAGRRVPSHRALERMILDGVAEAVDGCTVEPDGRCRHDSPSWLIELELI